MVAALGAVLRDAALLKDLVQLLFVGDGNPAKAERLARGLVLDVHRQAEASRGAGWAQHGEPRLVQAVLGRRGEGEADVDLVLALAVLLPVALHGEAVVQQKLGVALLTVRVHYLLASLQRREGGDGERVLVVLKGPACLAWAVVVKHVRVGHHGGALVAVHHDAKVTAADGGAHLEKLVKAKPRKLGADPADLVVVGAHVALALDNVLN
mmetsp:Transcript_992/g.2549  ORF Transcript_992/g.2549 Transcript_992/m.2549 type:complete len:210 (+) Transcript_992:717-1346(+)